MQQWNCGYTNILKLMLTCLIKAVKPSISFSIIKEGKWLESVWGRPSHELLIVGAGHRLCEKGLLFPQL